MFTDSYLPSRDGVVNSILTTKKRLEEMGHEVIVFAPDPGNENLRVEGTYYFNAIDYSKYKGYRIPIFPTNKCEILKKLKVDIIHTHGLFFMALRSMFAGRTLRLPVVVTFHTMITEAAEYYASLPLPKKLLDRLAWIYLRQLLERAEVVIAPTRAILDELYARAPGIRKGEVIPTGVNCEVFHPKVDGSRIRKKYGLEDKKIILHLGRVAWEKNMDLIIDAFELISQKRDDVVLMIAGEGPAREHYARIADERGLGEKIIFTGFVDDKELPEYYAACDAFALASKFETQGLVLLEAMACGKPVACINYRATAEIVRDGIDGYLFDDDVEDCARVIEKTLDAPSELRRRAVERARQYSTIECAQRLVKVYEYAIEQKRSRDGPPRC